MKDDAARQTAPVRALVEAWLRADFFSGSRGGGAPLVTALAFQAFLSAVFALLLFIDLRDVDFYFATLTFSAVLCLLTLLGDVGGLLRDGRHPRIVLHLPVTGGTILRARFLHAGIYLSLLALASALPGAILSFWVSGGALHAPFAYALVAWHQALLIGGVMALLYGISGGSRVARWMSWVQIVLMIFTLMILFTGVRYLPLLADVRRAEPGAFAWVPSAWFLGELGFLLPFQEVVPRLAWAWPGWLATLLVPVFTLWTWQRAGEGEERHDRKAGGRGWPWWRWLLPREPVERGAYEFTLRMLARDREFRLRAYPLFAFPLAMLALGMLGDQAEERGLYLNLVLYSMGAYLPVILSFLANSPYHRASWAFYVAPIASRERLRRGVARAVVAHLVLPLYLALGAISIFLRPPPALEGCIQPVLAFLVTLILIPGTVRDALPEGPFFRPTEQLQKLGNSGRMWVLVLLLPVLSILSDRYAARLLPAVLACAALGALAFLLWLPRQGHPLDHPPTEEETS